LTQLADHASSPSPIAGAAHAVIDALASMRFLDLSPDAMRMPSLPGQDVLGDRGENLSSVLQALCEDQTQKEAVLEWIRELTPLDVTDFEFSSDQTGRILVTLVEANGQRTSAYSASDGTLRFLAMVAAMLGSKRARCYFFEELDNGIHPTRLHLLLQLIEQQVSQGRTQVVATTHSPQLLAFLSPEAREHAALVYRLEEQPDARIKRIVDIPEARRVLAEQDLARLHSTGWLEDAVAFLEGAAQR
jgi:predicted ATPase